MRRLDPAEGRAAVLGGAVLGGGGGGDPSWGLALVDAAFTAGEVWLASTGDLSPDAVVVTAALVGAPSVEGCSVEPDDYWTAFELLRGQSGPVGALITNENGGLATVNGWYQAARAGLPLVDCPGNGRAHPTGEMGSLNLDQLAGYRATQACAGGIARLTMVVSGSLADCSRLVREASIRAGGLVAVARNPAPLFHVARNGAPGAIAQAIALGTAISSSLEPGARLSSARAFFGPAASTEIARLVRVTLSTAGGFDGGSLTLAGDDGREWELAFWNEYIIAQTAQGPQAVFPDLIATFDMTNGEVLNTAALPRLSSGHPIGLLLVPRQLLRLGRTMTRADLLAVVAGALRLPVLPEVPRSRGGGCLEGPLC